MPAFNFLCLNQTPYADALKLQERLFEREVENSTDQKQTSSTLIFLQHDPVYTLGKSGDIGNLKSPIEEIGADYFETNRGGDITYHGPGQLTGYPIFDLNSFKISVRQYVDLIEQCIIDCIADYGLKGERLEKASGVWLDAQTDNARKICAIGIKISKGISMHGFAFNINTDLNYFDHIVPCGIDDKEVTSLAKELGNEMNFYEVQLKLLEHFQKAFRKQ